MNRNIIKEIRNYIFAEEENFQLEHRIFLSAILIGLLTSILGGLINLILAPSPLAVLIPIVLSLLTFIVYYYVRFKKIFTPFTTPLIVLAIFGISAIWIFNGGINGSNIMPAFIILILGILVVPDKTQKYILLLFIGINILILLIQFFRPDLITDFPTETGRWIDNLITFIFSSYFIYLIIRFVHKNYTNEKLKAEMGEKKLRQLNADKDRFISILGHDLKSPFSNLLGLSELLAEEVRTLNTDEIENHVNNINKTARSTYNLLEDILIWARAQQGKLPFNPSILKIADICKSVLETLIPAADAKNIRINYSKT